MTVAHLAALPAPEVATVLFTPDDDFHDHADTWDLSDGAVALLTRAGSWSARNSKNGFVPSSMLARFSSDPVQAAAELCRRGIWKRVKGGCRFTDWERWGQLAEVIERKRADAAERQRKSRATRKEAGQNQKPQVAGGSVTRDKRVTSRVTPCDTPIDRSDLDQSIRGQSQDAYARDPDLLRIVAAEFGRKAGQIIGDAEAALVIATLTRRAEDAGTLIGRPEKYFPAGVRNEPDVYRLLDGDPPPLREILAEPIAGPTPGVHPFVPGENDRCAECEMPEENRGKHPEARFA